MSASQHTLQPAQSHNQWVCASQNRNHKGNKFRRKYCLGPTWRGLFTHARKLQHAKSCKSNSINVYTQNARQEPLFEILPERSNALLHSTPNPCPPIHSSLEMKHKEESSNNAITPSVLTNGVCWMYKICSCSQKIEIPWKNCRKEQSNGHLHNLISANEQHALFCY